MNPRFFLLCIALAGTPSIVDAKEPTLPIIYMNTDAQAPPDQVAVLLVNSKVADTGTLRCAIDRVAPWDGDNPKPDLHQPTILVVKPMRHTITAAYDGLRGGGYNYDDRVFKAGKRYRVYCDGLSFRSLKIVVEEM